jgi:biotin carboxylase
MGATANGIRVPDFSATFNYQEIEEFLQRVPPPWILKPRLMAGSIGIAKFWEKQELWNRIHGLGDRQSFFVLERFVPGAIFHVDSIWSRGELVYSIASGYGTPPFELTTEGGVFTTLTLEQGSEVDRLLRSSNERLLKAFGLADGVSHTEFIRAQADGEIYFLETSARVGGAHIADLIEQATGINLWAEWAKYEVAAALNLKYNFPTARSDYAGLLVSLARQEWPDTSGFTDPELVWRLKRRNHIGFIVKSSKRERVQQLLSQYSERVRQEFQATAPPTNRVSE